MGLDMYLKRKTYVRNWSHINPEKKVNITVTVGPESKPHPHINTTLISHIEEEVGYWRKAYHIHDWFVNNVQGGIDECQKSYVEPAKLGELIKICQEALDNPSKASDLLPTSHQEHDECYFDEIRETIKFIEPLIVMSESEGDEVIAGDIYYQASW